MIVCKDSEYLVKALALAKKRKGFTAPNPPVGCVIVREKAVIAEGLHYAAGLAHAEREALAKLGKQAQGAILYVTLEPCCHMGKTPPCTEAIAEAGIAKVVFGLRDPNPLVAGKGQKWLEQHGIECEQLVLAEVTQFYRSYTHWQKTKKPFVTAKLALSLDNKVAGEQGKPVLITGKEANQLTHRERKSADAILTTIETVLSDNPQLNARIDGKCYNKPVYVLDSQSRFPAEAKLYESAQAIILLHGGDGNPRKNTHDKLTMQAIPEGKAGLDLAVVIDTIGQAGIHDLWVEAGPTCFNALVQARLVNRVLLYQSKLRLGETALPANIHKEALLANAKTVASTVLGDDTVLELLF